MELFKCVIVDDEPNASGLLKLLIEEVDPDIEVAQIYDDPTIALVEIPRLKPDFLFLDVDMPFLTGFQLLERLPDAHMPVVFVTGFDEYAIKALRMSAIDYLLKPVNIEELRGAIKSVRSSLKKTDAAVKNSWLLENIKKADFSSRKLGIPSETSIEFVDIEDIICLEATERYTNVITEHKEPILSSYNIGEFAKLCDKSVFYQPHRSYIINLSKIERYLKDGTIIMTNGHSVPLARRRKDEFFTLMRDILPSR